MIRNLKVLGVALVAVFALGAVVASAASAQLGQGKLTSTGPVTLDGTESGTNALTAFGGKVECPGSTITGHKTLTNTETETGGVHELIPSGAVSITITMDLKQENCVAVEGGTTHRATVTLNGCDYDFRIGERTELKYPFEVDIVCPKEKDIAIDVYAFSTSELGGVACTITVKPQTGLRGASLKTTASFGEKWDLDASGTLTGIFASRSGFGCATQETSEGALHLNTTITGTNGAGGSTDLTVTGPFGA